MLQRRRKYVHAKYNNKQNNNIMRNRTPNVDSTAPSYPLAASNDSSFSESSADDEEETKQPVVPQSKLQ